MSFLETGRSQPSREMFLHLAERLEVPLRERNALLTAAGYAPAFAERRLDDPALAAARKAVELALAGHEPYPALAIDRHWTLRAANNAVAPLLAGAAASLLDPPVNVLRLSIDHDDIDGLHGGNALRRREAGKGIHYAGRKSEEEPGHQPAAERREKRQSEE